ncbi:MAG: OmpA family protein [Kofleriaceae bacterium]|jgi:outer membrane protein OmpA-like peptidoglycan-associated protein|nr:OmpA family protein [Kofleriaceae bacterium]MBP6840381.1 OmpA family protein [Kofleriaceae bacterium]MBP9208641.1 OmpA family protein [Kofleriaceae bacterium]
MSRRPVLLAACAPLHLVAAAAGLIVLVAPTDRAAAEPTELGVSIGPRFFSDDALLGYIADAPDHPHLTNAVALTARLGKPLVPWLVPEIELPVAVTSTNEYDVTVTWLAPRAQVRLQFLSAARVRPFLLLGGGATATLSSAKRIFKTDVAGEGYGGLGLDLVTGRRFHLRADARLAVGPGVDKRVTMEFEAGVGVWVALGTPAQPVGGGDRDGDGDGGGDDLDVSALDPDGDGLVGPDDQCPGKAEDHDGFEDRDGCPDIDNDLDRILDIADKCASVPESVNGFEDLDGCPDAMPAEVDALRGTVEGLLYAEGETDVRDSAQPSLQRLVDLLGKYPSVQIILVGHTDDREALVGVAPGEDGAAPDGEALALELARQRADAVRQAMIRLGLAPGRAQVQGKGAGEAVADNTSKRGRLANRRVELRLLVPER